MDSKSIEGNFVRVQVPPSAPRKNTGWCFFVAGPDLLCLAKASIRMQPALVRLAADYGARHRSQLSLTARPTLRHQEKTPDGVFLLRGRTCFALQRHPSGCNPHLCGWRLTTEPVTGVNRRYVSYFSFGKFLKNYKE